MSNIKEKLVIANCSGFFGDRITAAREMVQGGHIDVLTGDYLAELTMAILFRTKLQDPQKGYAATFLKQMEQVMGECLDKKIKIIANAGGLNPKGLAATLEKMAKELGLSPSIACIEGDDLMGRINELQEDGEPFTHLDKGKSLKEANAVPITANAYLGGWGISKALEAGADIVVGGRIADAALVSGPCAWKFNWKQNDWDRLAGAYVAGHIIECGAQATGGNYSFLEEVPSFHNVGFPVAEMHADGSFVITKHKNTGGLVSVGTVTAQLLYEIRDPAYLTPDVIARFDTITLKADGEDRVKVENVRGEPPTDHTKVCINNLYGYRNSMTVVLTGLDIGKKAKIVEDTFLETLGGRNAFSAIDIQLTRSGKDNPETNEDAYSYLRITVMDPDQKKAGKLFSSKIVELALANIPGFTLTSPPTNGMPAIQHWPALVSSKHICQRVMVGGAEHLVNAVLPIPDYPKPSVNEIPCSPMPKGQMISAPLGRAFATRSGDKGGNANLGVWSKTSQGYSFLKEFLTIDQLKRLLPDMKEYKMERHELPNLNALNFYIKGVLGEGAAASMRSDPQAKTLGEYLRAKVIDMPESILTSL
ncbi:MAG: DUF1446 domain-containing protein [Proteobacteria bacterium]|nr:DUF1446 domain-containing protein [Pseudomonadota bacterium]